MASTVDYGELVVTNETRFRDRSGRFVKLVEESCVIAAERLANRLQSFAEAFAPYRTGELISSLVTTATGFSAIVTASAPHAAYQEKGTGPHPIGALLQALSNPEEGFFALGPVAHPGTPATHFLSRAGAAAGREGKEIIAETLP